MCRNGDADSLSNSLRSFHIAIREHYDEFLSAITAHEIHPSNILAQTHRKLTKNIITGIVPILVIDLFEVIKVEHDNGQRSLAPHGACQQDRHMRIEIAAVVQPRETVRHRHRDRAVEALPQQIIVALPFDLGSQAREQLSFSSGRIR